VRLWLRYSDPELELGVSIVGDVPDELENSSNVRVSSSSCPVVVGERVSFT